MKALALTVWDRKIFKVFSFGCHGSGELKIGIKWFNYYKRNSQISINNFSTTALPFAKRSLILTTHKKKPSENIVGKGENAGN